MCQCLLGWVLTLLAPEGERWKALAPLKNGASACSSKMAASPPLGSGSSASTGYLGSPAGPKVAEPRPTSR